MIIVENTIQQMQEILDLWDITYDDEDEKYVARTNSYVVLDNEKLEWIGRMGLRIFSVERIEKTLLVRFSSGGGY